MPVRRAALNVATMFHNDIRRPVRSADPRLPRQLHEPALATGELVQRRQLPLAPDQPRPDTAGPSIEPPGAEAERSLCAGSGLPMKIGSRETVTAPRSPNSAHTAHRHRSPPMANSAARSDDAAARALRSLAFCCGLIVPHVAIALPQIAALGRRPSGR